MGTQNVVLNAYFQVLKAVVAQFDAGELITQREMVSARVNSELTARAEQVRVLLGNCSIRGVLNIWSNTTFWMQNGPFHYCPVYLTEISAQKAPENCVKHLKDPF